MIDPAQLYRNLLRSLGENYTPADMVRDYQACFGTPEGQRVLAGLWATATMTTPGATDDQLRTLEGRRSLIEQILLYTTATANEDGSMTMLSAPDVSAPQQANGTDNAG